MEKIAIILFILLSIKTEAQFNWQTQNSTVSINLNSTSFISKDTGWVVGNNGVILSTNDAGLNWNQQNSGTSIHLHSVIFVNSNIGWAVGNFGTILKTIDGGLNWITQTSGTTFNLFSISYSHLDNNILWTCGNSSILYSTNGGTSWVQQFNFTNQFKLYDIEVLNNNEAWTVGEQGLVYHTTDFGNTWTQHTTIFGDDYFDIDMYNGSYGWLVGDNGKINNTVDGGTWLPQSSNGLDKLNAISFYDTLNAVTVGNNGEFIQTSDGGLNWNILPFPSNENLNDVQFFDDSTAVVVTNNGEIYYSPFTPGNSETTEITSETIGDYNLITPNGDGNNDILYLDLKGELENTFILYNRWGNEINRINNYDNNSISWNGTNKNGEELSSSTYFYVFQIPEINFQKRGWVELIR